MTARSVADGKMANWKPVKIRIIKDTCFHSPGAIVNGMLDEDGKLYASAMGDMYEEMGPDDAELFTDSKERQHFYHHFHDGKCSCGIGHKGV